MRTCRKSCCIALTVAMSVAAPSAWAAAACESLGPCAARACRLDAQIARARDQGKPREVAALERQRAEMAHCSDEGLAQKRKMALEQAQARVDRREAELKRAEAGGDTAKISKARRNLQSARKAYDEIERSPL